MITKHIEGDFLGKLDYKLYYQSWLSQEAPKAVIIIAHGIVEHSGRYQRIANYLAEKSYAVYAFDYRNHGRSQGQKGHVDDFAYFIDDLRTFYQLVKSKHPNNKIFLFGHSMGAAISLAYSEKYSAELAGIMVSGSPLCIQPQLPTAVIALIYPLALIVPRMPFYRLDSSTLSSDKKVVDSYDNDPLVFRGKLTTRLLLSFLWELHKIRAGLSKIQVPILIMHGSEDKLCLPAGSESALRGISSTDKVIQIYQGFFHEILNEPQYAEVQADMLAWLNKHTCA
jgi:acylglycerol lipase